MAFPFLPAWLHGSQWSVRIGMLLQSIEMATRVSRWASIFTNGSQKNAPETALLKANGALGAEVAFASAAGAIDWVP